MYKAHLRHKVLGIF